ncbi:MAG: hypothetical protein ACOX8A_12565, partial [Thermacetogeniaceae bacterium]
QWNSEKTWGGYTVVSPGHFAIPKECKYPEAAIRNADLYFIDKWAHHFWIGPKKDSEEALGYPGWYWDDEGATTFDYPEGITNAWDMINCCVNPVCGFFGKYQVAKRYLKEAFDYEAPYDPDSIENTWRESMNKRTTPYCKPRFPTVYLEPEAQERIREIETAMWDYAEPIEARLIVGEEPLTDENLDKYFAEMKTIGAEEYEQIYKDAYEIYLSSLEG